MNPRVSLYIKLILIAFTYAAAFPLRAQPKCFIEHYSTEDGLPEQTVMDILQDRYGFMWFSTWNGLCKFDGYHFYTYQIQQDNMQHMRSNRIDRIVEDKYGYIWALPYDSEAFRFDPRTEQFMSIRSLKPYEDLSFSTSKIIPTKTGKVWLTSQSMGCVAIDSNFQVTTYNIGNSKIQGNQVYSIYEDSCSNTWILTNNGLYQQMNNADELHPYFISNNKTLSTFKQHFYACKELSQELWFASDNGRIWIYNKKTKQFHLLELPNATNLTNIKSINTDQLVITTSSDGFYIYNILRKTFKHYTSHELPEMKVNQILSCYVDRSENIWFELNALGVFKFNVKTQYMKHFTPKVESTLAEVYPPNFYIMEDANNQLWVHPRGGGFSYYDSAKDALIPFYNEPLSTNWRFSNMIHCLFSDKQNNLWLSTRSHGLEKVVFNNNMFNTSIVDSNIHSSVNNDIRSLIEDSKQQLWVSTKQEKTFVCDTLGHVMGYVCEDGTIGFGVPLKGVVYCALEDDKKNIWLGTKGKGVYELIPEEHKRRYKINHYENNPNDLYSLSHNYVYSIFQDKFKRIWVGTYGGGINLKDTEHENRFINSKNLLKKYPIQFASQVRVISSDSSGNICVGTTLGLIVFSPSQNAEEMEFKSYIKTPDNDQSLGGNDVYDIYTTKKGETYIATFGGGLNKIEQVDTLGFPTQFTTYTTKDGLPSDVMLKLNEDNAGNLWMTTEGNLTKLNPLTKTFETYGEINRLITGQNFSEGASCKTHDGRVLFGFSKGIISINSSQEPPTNFKPYIAFTQFQIANKNVPIGGKILKQQINNVHTLKLNHNQNSISFEFAALDYSDPLKITYAYKLEGFDKDWNLTQKQRKANYTNLPPNKYTFRVKSTNSNGVWINNERSIAVEITPAFTQTPWAYILYFLFAIGVIYGIFKALLAYDRLKFRIQLEHDETEMKSRFFTDISHEIRTPLTMIVSPIENILDAYHLNDTIKEQLQLVLRNAHRMLLMVNQILDFRKIHKQSLHIQETPIGKFIVDICVHFEKTSTYSGVKLILKNQLHNETLWIDRDDIEKLVLNLLSNAYKFTPKGKAITVTLSSQRDGYLQLEIQDEGPGISKEIQEKIFTRFASFNTDKSKPSTGIGLSIVKEIVDKHHAKIQVESESNSGTNFKVSFPTGIKHFSKDENITYGEAFISENACEETAKESIVIDESPPQNKPMLLIVEDDNDLRDFIKTMLVPYYQILEATDGEDGYHKALAHIPDFIISDIMMPIMDGIELLQKIRIHSHTSHIPFILLTAKSNIENQLEGLNYGADDYITKPFSVRYLKARIDNIIKRRMQLAVLYTGGKLSAIEDSNKINLEQSITPKDDYFLHKVKELIISNLENEKFVVDDLATATAMSRTVFFRKLKSLTGLAPIEFIRDVKIRHAAHLLESEDYHIKEISFMIGIADTKYFSQCFKKIYHVTPSEYRKNSKK